MQSETSYHVLHGHFFVTSLGLVWGGLPRYFSLRHHILCKHLVPGFYVQATRIQPRVRRTQDSQEIRIARSSRLLNPLMALYCSLKSSHMDILSLAFHLT